MRYLLKPAKDSRGITGVETAIIVMSFFVAAGFLGTTAVKFGLNNSSGTTELVEGTVSDTTPAMRVSQVDPIIRTAVRLK